MSQIIKQILVVDDLPGTPARVNRKTGTLIVSKAFKALDPVYQKFVYYHEEAHVALDSKDEEMCDEYAMRKLLKEGYPLTKILKSITRVLSFNKESHYGRALSIFEKLRQYDFLVNGNKRVYNNQNFNSMQAIDPAYTIDDIYLSQFEGDDYSDFLGLGKKARERREERREARAERKEARMNRKNLRAESKANMNNAKADVMRATGVIPQSGASGILGQVGGIVGGIFGKGAQQQEFVDDPENDKKDNTTTWIIVAVVIIILIIVAFFIFRKKKGK